MLDTTEDTPLVRTDYSNPSAWDELYRVVTTPTEEGFAAYVEFLEDDEYHDLTLDQVLALIPEPNYQHRMIIVADAITLASAELPLLCVDLDDEPGFAIRVIAAELYSIQNNISIVNMDFGEFADAVDTDGVFRGF